MLVSTPTGTSTNQIRLNNIAWPAVAGLTQYMIFAASQDDLISLQVEAALTAGPGNSYTPGSLTLTSAALRGSVGLPTNNTAKLRLKAKRVDNSGVMGWQVVTVNPPNQIVIPGLINTTGYSPVGRVLSVIGRATGATPFLNLLISGFDATTGTLTLSPQAVISGNPDYSVQVGDIVVIRFKADAANTSNPTSITDSGMCSPEYPTGMTPGACVGLLLRVIAGTGRGQVRKVTANTATSWSWDLPLLLDTTSVWIIEEPLWIFQGDSAAFANADPAASTTLNMPVDNLATQTLLVAGFTVDQSGVEAADGDEPLREVYIFGSGGLSKIAGLCFQMSGTLGIESNAAQPLYLNRAVTAGDVKAYLQDAPTGSGLTFVIYVGGAAWLTLTIPAGQTSIEASPTQIVALTAIPANTAITVGITAVGTTFPGADLSVFIYS